MVQGVFASAYADRRERMPNALRIGLLGPLRLQDEGGCVVPVGGLQLRVLFTLLALNTGRVVPAGSMAEQIWPDGPPGRPPRFAHACPLRRSTCAFCGVSKDSRPLA
jgi:hypothetical protein